VPNPAGSGMVRATVVAPAEAGRAPRYAWVRIDEGKEAGHNERVSYGAIERCL